MSRSYDWSLWKTTGEEITRIAAGDSELLNRFFSANYDFFSAMARNYAKYGGYSFSDVPEVLAQLYLDIPNLRINNPISFVNEIRSKSFAWFQYGGYTQRKAQGLLCNKKPCEIYSEEVLSLDFDLFEDGTSIIDFIRNPAEDEPEEVLLKKIEIPNWIVQGGEDFSSPPL